MHRFAHILIVAGSALALAACGSKSTETITTTKDGKTTVTGDAGADIKLQPGKWEMTVQVSDFKMAGMANVPAAPPAATQTTCITPEQASKGPADMLKGAQADCTATRSTTSAGKIDVAMTCKMPGGGAMSMKSSGTFTPTEMTSDTEMSTTGEHAMSQKIHTTAKRVGDCA